jgi:hypothetical protein
VTDNSVPPPKQQFDGSFPPFFYDPRGLLFKNGKLIRGVPPLSRKILGTILSDRTKLWSYVDLAASAWGPNSEKTYHDVQQATRPLLRILRYRRHCFIENIPHCFIENVESGGYCFVPLVSGSSGNSRFYDGGLPPLQAFFGRVKEWEALDKAYENPRTRLAIISGPVGGEGKSQLAHHWLNAKFEKSQRGLQVFTFSFNSQGTSEKRQTSSDPFFNKALSWFGVQVDAKALAEEKAEQLAHAIVRERAILYLDGTEPLQYEPTGGIGSLRQRAMRVLLRNLARIGNHFCLISTRCLISEVKGDPGVKHISLKGLGPRAAIDLLKHYGVRSEIEGKNTPLRKMAKRWNYQPISLVLLSTYLAKYCDGDVRGLDTIRELRRVFDSPSLPYRPELMLKAHERRLAQTNQGALQLLRVLGLFDRPVDERWVSELIRPPIPGISDKLRSNWSSPDLRNAMLKDLIDLGLISTKDQFLSRHIYCHALVQQYQGQSGRSRFRSGWRQAHVRLFRYFASLVEEPRPKTADEMQTLYQAVAHGCAAGQFEKAFDEVYWPRISRETQWIQPSLPTILGT